MNANQLADALDAYARGTYHAVDFKQPRHETLIRAAAALRGLEAVRSHAARFVALAESVPQPNLSDAYRDLRAALAAVEGEP